MGIRTKIMSGLAIATMGTVLGVGGFAFASVIQDRRVDSVSGSSESSRGATVTGTQTGTLLPGESALVTFVLTTPKQCESEIAEHHSGVRSSSTMSWTPPTRPTATTSSNCPQPARIFSCRHSRSARRTSRSS